MKLSNKWISATSRHSTRVDKSEVRLQFSASYTPASKHTCNVDFNRESETEPYNEWLKLQMTIEEAEQFAFKLLDIAKRARELGPDK